MRIIFRSYYECGLDSDAHPAWRFAIFEERGARGWLIRLVDATVVAKASRSERTAGGVWRVHAVFNLDGANERFSAFELTDEREV